MKLLNLICGVALLSLGTLPAQDAAKTFTVQDGALPWSDRAEWSLDSVPDALKGAALLPQQLCGSRVVTVPGQPASILVGVAEKDLAAFEALPLGAQKTGDTFNLKNANGSVLPYLVYRVDHPPASVGGGLSAGMVLLKVDDTALAAVPVPAAPPAPAKPVPPPAAPFEVGNAKTFHVYLLFGQSNMLGRDTTGLDAQVPDPRVAAFDGKGQWVVAVEPIGPGGTGFGPGTFFAVELLKSDLYKDDPAARIGLVQCAVGGTPLSRWVKGADLYESALKRLRQALKAGGTLDGALWHQGESDGNDPALASTYEARLKQMLQDLRADLARPDLPIVVGQLGEFVQGKAIAGVRAGIKSMPNDLPLVGYADSAGLGHKGDHLHFNVEGQRGMGTRDADAMVALLKAKADGGVPAPAP